MGWREMGYIFYSKNKNSTQTEVSMKLETEGGFSSKLRIESLIESGHEARTHRPSPSLNITNHNITQNHDPNIWKETSRNKVSIPEGVLG